MEEGDWNGRSYCKERQIVDNYRNLCLCGMSYVKEYISLSLELVVYEMYKILPHVIRRYFYVTALKPLKSKMVLYSTRVQFLGL
uniref:Uncharacterized protein n=1 Tax=Salix viminalis TaxID=40686 RepID=A0A6N2KDH2_SALVM